MKMMRNGKRKKEREGWGMWDISKEWGKIRIILVRRKERDMEM